MANRTLTQATALAGVDIASDDELWIWDVTAAALRKCTRADLIGGVITGGGTVATGGFTLTVPATGTAALQSVDVVFGRVTATVFSGTTVTIADDAIVTLSVATYPGGLLLVSVANLSTGGALFAYRADTSVFCTVVAQPSTNYETSTSVLNAGGGTDGKITISATGNTIYVSNRSGASRTMRFTLIA